MRFSLRGQVVKLLYGTRLESSARKVYEYLFQRDNYEVNRRIVEVMRRALRPDATCVDVGCYRGEILRHMLRLCPKGEVFAFEPAPRHHDFLKRTFPRAQLFPVALGAAFGTATFYSHSERPARSGLALAETPRPAEQIEELTVTVDKLDNVIPTEMLLDFLKIDVEGAEYDVIRGGKDVIRRSQPLIVDLAP